MEEYRFWTLAHAGGFVIKLFLGLALFVFANYALKKILQYVQKRFHNKQGGWKDKLEHIVYLPLHAIFWVLGSAYVLGILANQLGFPAGWDYLRPIRSTLVVLCVSWLCLRWKKRR